ncbi:hypothetical protein Taro_012800, partial [Colocasia esculenta]|nr:hypothetical protein [Colocasia esculenta]
VGREGRRGGGGAVTGGGGGSAAVLLVAATSSPIAGIASPLHAVSRLPHCSAAIWCVKKVDHDPNANPHPMKRASLVPRCCFWLSCLFWGHSSYASVGPFSAPRMVDLVMEELREELIANEATSSIKPQQITYIIPGMKDLDHTEIIDFVQKAHDLMCKTHLFWSVRGLSFWKRTNWSRLRNLLRLYMAAGSHLKTIVLMFCFQRMKFILLSRRVKDFLLFTSLVLLLWFWSIHDAAWHHQHGRWQARIGRVAENKDLYLGTFTQLLHVRPESVLIESTGVIGQRIKKMPHRVPVLKRYPAKLFVTAFTCMFGLPHFLAIAAFT